MKNLMKRVSTLVLAGGLIFGATGVPVSAAQAEGTSNGHKFTSAWTATASYKKGSVTYGFNTCAINEDFAWAYHSTCRHYAALLNGNDWHHGSSKGKGEWSKIEVRHCYDGTPIKYVCNW